MTALITTHISLPAEMLADIDAIALERMASRSYILRLAVHTYLQSLKEKKTWQYMSIN
jgi:metal-responsive CopG/Arc/MetJ family transcriptional regulator